VNVRAVVVLLVICGAPCHADPIAIARDAERDLSALQLTGKTGRAAIDSMIAEGYQCGLEAAMTLVPGLDAPATVGCSRDWGEECGSLNVTIFFRWDDAEKSLQTLFETLTTSPVVGLQALCVFPPVLPPAYLLEKSSAETELSRKLGEIVRVGDGADSAFGSLLMSGFRCGLRSSSQLPAGARDSLPQLRCSRLPSATEYCYREEVWLDVTWRDRSEAPLRLLDQLGDARIAGVRAVCGLPRIEGNTHETIAQRAAQRAGRGYLAMPRLLVPEPAANELPDTSVNLPSLMFTAIG
jgi:hypothetical protein